MKTIKKEYKKEILEGSYIVGSVRNLEDYDNIKNIDFYGIDHVIIFLSNLEIKNKNENVYYSVGFRGEVFVSNNIKSIMDFIIGINHFGNQLSNGLRIQELTTIEEAVLTIVQYYGAVNRFKELESKYASRNS